MASTKDTNTALRDESTSTLGQKDSAAERSDAAYKDRRGKVRLPTGRTINVADLSDHDKARLGIQDPVADKESMERAAEAFNAIEDARVDGLEGETTRPIDFEDVDTSVKPGFDFESIEVDPITGAPRTDTLEAAAARIEAALAAEDEATERAGEDSADEQDGSDEQGAPDEQDDPDEEAEADEQPAAPAALNLKEHGSQLVQIKENGEVKAVPLSELAQDGLRARDYTKKSQALAAERADFSKQQEALALTAGILSEFTEGLDPAQKSALRAVAAEVVGNVQAEHQRRQAELSATAAARMVESESQLRQALGWQELSESEVLSQKMELAGQASEAYGVGLDELAQVEDYRLLVMLNDAVAYRRGADRLNGSARAGTKPRGRDGRFKKAVNLEPGNADRRNTSAAQRGKAKLGKLQDRLQRTGSVNDAARVFEALLDD